MSGVEIRVRSNSSQARQDLSKLQKSVSSLDGTAKKVTNSFRNLAIGITAAFSIKSTISAINKASDSITNLGNRISLVTGRGEELQATLKELYGIAARARLPVAVAADTFNRFGLALQDSGKSTRSILTVTEAVAQSATISGATAQSAEAAIVQLGQGLASGELRGQELNSVLEQIPRLARAIAEGMGVPFGELRQRAKDGQLTAESVFNAIISQAGEIGSEFEGLNATVGGLTSVLNDEFARALSVLDKEVGFSESFKEDLILLTNIFRAFSDNFSVFARLTSSEFRIFRNEVFFFSEGVKDSIKNIFNFDAL